MDSLVEWHFVGEDQACLVPSSDWPMRALIREKYRPYHELWDRKTLRHIFDFDYIWEVYKPEKVRKWGYYVLPVFYADRFVVRVDSRLEQGIWTISRWWWEPDVTPDAEMLDALRIAVKDFLHYLRAVDVRIGDGVDLGVREVIVGFTVSS